MTDKHPIPLTLQAYKTLKKRIMDFRLRPGEILMIQSLAKELGISRTPVREAVVRLEREGFVRAAAGKKFKVSALTMESIHEIHEIRKLMELHAVRSVSLASTQSQIAKIGAIIQSMKTALSNKSHDDFFDADLAFHEKIIEFHGNKTLEQMMNQINDKIQRIRYMTNFIANRLEETIGEHQDILDAIEGHDPDRAEQTMAYHLEKVKNGIDALFDNNPAPFIGGMFFE